MKNILSFLFLLFIASQTFAQKTTVSGSVTNTKQEPLFNASVYIKNAQTGSGTNINGDYILKLLPGDYTVICRYLGFKKQAKDIHVGDQPVRLNFVMQPLAVHIDEVVIHAGPDPAYAIIKKAIEKRPFYENQVKSYSCMAYVKGVVGLKDGPDKMLGQEIDYSGEILDSTHSGIFYLTESLSKISRQYPKQYRQTVIASRMVGGGMGFDFPVFIDFYKNNTTLLTRQLAPRGYISPIADRALHYYKYRLDGTFMEDGHLVNKIQVIPRRKHEPLFSGYINIMDSSWRIHSLNLLATKQYQLQIIDSLYINQIHAPVAPGIWRIRNQSLRFNLDLLKFHLRGRFLNVYSDYMINPPFPEEYFDSRIILSYDSMALKRDTAYWNDMRPVPFNKKEEKYAVQKDSLHKVRVDSLHSKHYMDSLQKAQNSPGVMDFLWSGFRWKHYVRPRFRFRWHSLLKNISYNTVEGLVTKVDFTLKNYSDSGHQWHISPAVRYGWSNHHLNANIHASYQKNKQTGILWRLAGGRRISQINKSNPISPLVNSLYTLLGRKNYMKIYENYFFSLNAKKKYNNGLLWRIAALCEDRYPLYNTSDFSIFKNGDRSFTPNHPLPLAGKSFIRHQAFEIGLQLQYQPGQRYIQYPSHKVSVGSKAPVFGLGYIKGIPDVLGSETDFDKWYFTLQDGFNMKLKGAIKYKIQVGGFLNRKRVGLPDMTHFNGNQTFFNSRYLNSFQLAPYYRYSNVASFYSKLNMEYHLNGFLTNKIPLFNRLNWNLVLGTNAFYVDKDKNYIEGFAGLENIFKVFRIDFITGYQSGAKNSFGVRVGLGGILGGAIAIR